MQELSPRQKLSLLIQYQAIPREPIRHKIPKRSGINSLGTFKMLMTITDHPGLNMSQLRFYFNTQNTSLCNSVQYLLELGYISVIKKPRWIPKISAWIVDDAYKPTQKGKEIVFNILDLIQINSEPIEINGV